jgi:hypothetical protein
MPNWAEQVTAIATAVGAPSIDALGGPDVYPLFARLVTRMRTALAASGALPPRSS